MHTTWADELGEAIDRVGKVLADLDPDLLSPAVANDYIREFARGEKLCASGRTLLARVVRDAKAMAKAAGITEGEAAQNVKASQTAADQPGLDQALRSGELSSAQANAVAQGAAADPSSLDKLLASAKERSVNELRDEARDVVARAKGANDHHRAQRAAREFSHGTDALGMVSGRFRLTPEIGAAVIARIEAEARRVFKAGKQESEPPTYPQALADALAALVTGATGSGRRPKAEVVIDLSYPALVRGWAEGDEVCSVRGFGPIPVWRAQEILEDAFIKAVVTDGVDVTLVKHFGTYIPAELKTALQWRHRVCVDCGSKFHLEDDHIKPRASGGLTSYGNVEPRCWPCHVKKTEDDRRQGLLGNSPPTRRR